MRRWPATHTYYLREAIGAFNSGLIFTSIWTFYYQVLHLTLVQVSVIYVIITVTGILLEVPTGIIADVYSRRLSVILGGIFIGLCYTTAGIFPFYFVVLIGAFLEAVGDTCVSGALEAWITDEVGAENVGPVFVRSAQISAPMHWLGVAISIGLAAVFNYQVPIALGGVLWLLLTLVLITKMPETAFVTSAALPYRTMREQMRAAGATFLRGIQTIRSSAVVMRLVVAGFFATALLDIFYRFSRLLFLEGFSLPVVTVPLLGTLKDNLWFGLFEVAQGILTLLGLTILRRFTATQHAPTFAGILTLFHSIMLVGLLVFAGTSSLSFAIGAWLLITVLHDLGRPLVATWLNQTIDAPSRATVLSIHSQISMLGMLTLGSGMSVVGDAYGVRPALLVASIFLLPIVVLYFRGWRQGNAT